LYLIKQEDNDDSATKMSSSLNAASIALPIPENTAAPWDDISFRYGSGDSSSSSISTTDPKVGVLLLNLGGPETSDDVEGTLI
jgi:hypothetical protein